MKIWIFCSTKLSKHKIWLEVHLKKNKHNSNNVSIFLSSLAFQFSEISSSHSNPATYKYKLTLLINHNLLEKKKKTVQHSSRFNRELLMIQGTYWWILIAWKASVITFTPQHFSPGKSTFQAHLWCHESLLIMIH